MAAGPGAPPPSAFAPFSIFAAYGTSAAGQKELIKIITVSLIRRMSSPSEDDEREGYVSLHACNSLQELDAQNVSPYFYSASHIDHIITIAETGNIASMVPIVDEQISDYILMNGNDTDSRIIYNQVLDYIAPPMGMLSLPFLLAQMLVTAALAEKAIIHNCVPTNRANDLVNWFLQYLSQWNWGCWLFNHGGLTNMLESLYMVDTDERINLYEEEVATACHGLAANTPTVPHNARTGLSHTLPDLANEVATLIRRVTQVTTA